MKKIYNVFAIIALSILTLSASKTEAQEIKTYVLSFPEYEMKDIKPLVALTQPLFNAQIEIKDDNYKVFYFKSSNVVTEEDVKRALEGSKYQLNLFEIRKQ
jgi:hypothetical protein